MLVEGHTLRSGSTHSSCGFSTLTALMPALGVPELRRGAEGCCFQSACLKVTRFIA